MKVRTFIEEEKLITQATRILFEKLGPVEAGRFLSLPRKRRMESVKQHRKWQSKLDKEQFFDEVFKTDAKSRQKVGE